MDDRRARNHVRDLEIVLAAMPSVTSWSPSVTTAEVVRVVRLPRSTVLHLLHELDVSGLAAEAGAYGGGLTTDNRRPSGQSVDRRQAE